MTSQPAAVKRITLKKQGAGMIPERVHAYLLLAIDYGPPGMGFAVITTITEGAPVPRPYGVAHSGGAAGALQLAEEVVRGLPGNQGMEQVE